MSFYMVGFGRIVLDPATTTGRCVDGLLKKSKLLAVVKGDRYLDGVVLRDLRIGDSMTDDSLQNEAEADASQRVEPRQRVAKLCSAHLIETTHSALDY